MKKLIVTLLIGLSTLAFASPENECVKNAGFSGIEKADALELCAGARSDAPLLCYKTVTSNNFGKIDKKASIKLCRFAKSTEATNCYRDAITFNQLTQDQAVELCRVHCNTN